MAIDTFDPRETEALKMREKQLKTLGKEGTLFEGFNNDRWSLIGNKISSMRSNIENPEYDKRPGLKKILEQAKHYSFIPDELQSLLCEVIAVAINDFDASAELTKPLENTEAPGFLFEQFRGWTTEDFQSLLTLLDNEGVLLQPIPDIDFETLRKKSIAKQEALDYDEKRDLKVIKEVDTPLLYKGYAFERLFKKLKAEPQYIETIRNIFAPEPLETMETFYYRNEPNASAKLEEENKFKREKNLWKQKILQFIEEKTAE